MHTYLYLHTFVYMYVYTHIYRYIYLSIHVTCVCRRTQEAIRPTQSIMYVPSQVNRFQESILLILQHTYLKSCSGDFILQNLILRTRSCGTVFITQQCWVFYFRQTTLVWWKCFVPQLYQFRRGISGGPALKYFYMIHRGGRTHTCYVNM